MRHHSASAAKPSRDRKTGAALGRLAVLCVLAGSLAGCGIHPQPLTQEEFALRAAANIQGLTLGQEPVSRTIGLGEAVARALKYNLALRVKQDQIAVASAKLDIRGYAMLPEIVMNSGYVSRNNYQASTSLNLVTGQRDTDPSTSQDRNQYSKDISIGWDILDFGLSYVRAQQAADDVLIAREMWRTTLHKLVEEVRTQYWRASTYQRLIGRLKALDRRTGAALANSRKLSLGSEVNRLEVLNSERELVRVKQAIKDLEQELIDAKSELATLMNLKPGTPYTLDASRPDHKRFKLDMPLDEVLEMAVANRPEMRQNFYEQRINVKEAQVNLLELFPSMRLYSSDNRSSNSFLLNADWVSVGAAMSWNLINAFRYPAKQKAQKTKQEMIRRQALATCMTIVSQVYMGLNRYDYFQDRLSMSERFLSVQRRLTQQMRLEAQAERVSEQELILEEMNELIAEAKFDMAYADLEKAHGGLIASIGLDPTPLLDPAAPVAVLSSALEEGWKNAFVPSRDPRTRHPAPAQ
ncbi:TolC family protein [bacterium]|nr:TolC family protein [bacterium]